MNEENNFEVEEIELEKDRSLGDKRRTDWMKAISRFNLVQNITKHRKLKKQHSLGYFRNNNEANACVGKSKKTNTRKASASYRHKGGFGKADKYAPKDQRRIDSMEQSKGEEV